MPRELDLRLLDIDTGRPLEDLDDSSATYNDDGGRISSVLGVYRSWRRGFLDSEFKNFD